MSKINDLAKDLLNLVKECNYEDCPNCILNKVVHKEFIDNLNNSHEDWFKEFTLCELMDKVNVREENKS